MNLNAIKTLTIKGVLLAQKHSPLILTSVGVVGVVGASILACRATLRVEPILDKINKDVSNIKEMDDNGDYVEGGKINDLVSTYSVAAVDIAREYLPSIIIGTVSIGCLIGSHNILQRRNVAVVAAYTAIDKGFKQYRNNVIEDVGTDKDKEYLRGRKIEEIEEIIDGKSITKNIETGIRPHASQYAKYFQDDNPNWQRNAEYNLNFIRSVQNYLNDLLIANGVVFLNEAYKALGIPITTAGQVVGWLNNEETNGDGYIDFGLYNINNVDTRDFVNGHEPNVLLDFNVDGIVFDLI